MALHDSSPMRGNKGIFQGGDSLISGKLLWGEKKYRDNTVTRWHRQRDEEMRVSKQWPCNPLGKPVSLSSFRYEM